MNGVVNGVVIDLRSKLECEFGNVNVGFRVCVCEWCMECEIL